MFREPWGRASSGGGSSGRLRAGNILPAVALLVSAAVGGRFRRRGGWAFRGAAVYAFGPMKVGWNLFFGPAARCLSFAGSVAVLREPDRRFCFGASDSGKLRGSEDGRGLLGTIAGFGRWAGRPVLGGLWPGGAAVRGRSGLYRSIRLAFRVAIFRLTGAGTPSGARDLCRGCCRPDRKMPCRASVHSSAELRWRDHPFGGFFERRIVLRSRRGETIPGGIEPDRFGTDGAHSGRAGVSRSRRFSPSGESFRQSDGDSFGVGQRRCPVGFGGWIRWCRTGGEGRRRFRPVGCSCDGPVGPENAAALRRVGRCGRRWAV